MHVRIISFAAFAMMATASAFAQTTYTWNGTTTDYQVSTNWTPTRTTPAVDDILVFDGAVTAGAITVTNIPSGTVQVTPMETIGKLILQNSANVTWTSNGVPPGAAVANVQPSAAANDVIQISANSILTFGGDFDIVMRLPVGSTATINGTVRFTSSASASQLHRWIAGSPAGITFASGSKFENAPVFTASNSNIFGGVGVGPTVFAAGSKLYNGGTAAGPGTGIGGNPTNNGNTTVAFEPGSEVVQHGTALVTASGTDRLFGDLTFDNRVHATFNTLNTTGIGICTVDGNLTFKSTHGAGGGGSRWAAAGAGGVPNLIVTGNFTVESGGVYEDLSAPAIPAIIEARGNVSWLGTGTRLAVNNTRALLMKGTSAQTLEISEFGEFSPGVPTRNTLYDLTIDNAAGVTVVGAAPVRVRNLVTLTNGNLAGPIILETPTTVAGGGLLTGAVTRLLDASVTGTYTIPTADAPVSVQITGAGTGSGSITGVTSGIAGSGLPGGFVGINRTWTLTPASISGWTATVVLTYKDSDLGATTESALQAARFNGSTWDVLPSTVNTSANTVTVAGVTSLSQWTLVSAGPPASFAAAWGNYE